MTHAQCRCVRPDQSSATVRLHYLTDGNVNFAFTINRAEYFLPVAMLFKALLEVRFWAIPRFCSSPDLALTAVHSCTASRPLTIRLAHGMLFQCIVRHRGW